MNWRKRKVIQLFELDGLYHVRDVFDRYFNWHNNKKRTLGKKSLVNYLNRVFHLHSIKPPTAISGEFVKGDDANKK